MTRAKKILMVEDDASHREPVATKLQSEGFNVVQAKNGEEGLAKAQTERPDLILLDIIMPKMDGLTMLKKLRADETIGTTPVIMLTNLGSGSTNVDDLAISAYLVKSNWKLEDLIQKIKEII